MRSGTEKPFRFFAPVAVILHNLPFEGQGTRPLEMQEIKVKAVDTRQILQQVDKNGVCSE